MCIVQNCRYSKCSKILNNKVWASKKRTRALLRYVTIFAFTLLPWPRILQWLVKNQAGQTNAQTSWGFYHSYIWLPWIIIEDKRNQIAISVIYATQCILFPIERAIDVLIVLGLSVNTYVKRLDFSCNSSQLVEKVFGISELLAS